MAKVRLRRAMGPKSDIRPASHLPNIGWANCGSEERMERTSWRTRGVQLGCTAYLAAAFAASTDAALAQSAQSPPAQRGMRCGFRGGGAGRRR
jgi:hypothetical protein